MALVSQAGEFGITYSIPVLILSLILHLTRNRYKDRHLRAIPGPFLASLTDIWTAHCWLGNPHEEHLLHRKYNSPLLRIGPSKVVVTDPQAIQVIYGLKTVFQNVCLIAIILLHEPPVNSTSKVFIREIENPFILPRKECDLAKWLQMYAFDVM